MVFRQDLDHDRVGVRILSTFVGKYTTYCGSSDVDGKKGKDDFAMDDVFFV